MIQAMTLSDLAIRFGGTLYYPDCSFTGVSTDSRTLAAGELFVALRGERFDAHEFLPDVARRACGLVVERPQRELEIPQWVVPDTTAALGDIARLAREAFTGKLVALTGSSGKTSVKEMLAAILSGCGATLATQGNLNNHIGVPRTLLSLSAAHRFAVVEMGASGPGEIDYLTRMARPDVALVNNVMPAHVEGFGSLQAIADTKGAIYRGLPADGTAVLNIDEPWCDSWRALLPCRNSLTFSMSGEADFSPRDIEEEPGQGSRFVLATPAGEAPVQLALPGRHNIANALAAAACAFAAGAGLDVIVAGLSLVQPIKGRLQVVVGVNGAKVLDDSYNANPGSVKAAIDVLAEYPGERLLVMGDMAELGSEAGKLHREVGEHARLRRIDGLWLTGRYAEATAAGFGDRAQVFADKITLAHSLRARLGKGITVLVKGSRSAAMDEVVREIADSGPCGGNP